MKTITKQQFLKNKEFYLQEIKAGKIFIYPTDTIYGIGCIATNSKAIQKIRKIKKREVKPFLIIVPGKTWIKENCKIPSLHKEYLNKLPGRFTFILELENKEIISIKDITGDSLKIGIRIPDSWFTEFLTENKVSFISTSVNCSGEPHIIKISELQDNIKEQVDYIINEGIIDNKPSTILDLTEKQIKKLR